MSHQNTTGSTNTDVIRLQVLQNNDVALEPLLSLTEAAVILNVSEKTLRDWVWQKKIEYVKVGSRIRFSPAVLRAFIRNRTVRVQ